MKIKRIEWCRLEAKRPRTAGSNARLGVHGDTIHPPVARITADDGAMGFGVSSLSEEHAIGLLGANLDTAFSLQSGGTTKTYRDIDFPLWDLMARRAGKPVYALAASVSSDTALRVRCYDTSLYFDDLHITDETEAAAFIAAEAREGFEKGHRAFKIKVGRGAIHLPLEEGTRRDIAVIRAVRDAVGPEPPLLIDANNGYNLNLTKHVLGETADCGIYWMEEAFHEDAVLYRHLKTWLQEENLPVLIADGEGEASPSLMRWAAEGIVDVVQYDIFGHGFTRWLQTSKALDEVGARSAPHHYGAAFGNYVTGHLASACCGFTFVEWDDAEIKGVHANGYTINDGWLTIPNTPGFGLELDEAVFAETVQENGFSVAI